MDRFEINYLDSRQGVQTVQINNYLLHSKYDPIKEAKQIAEREYKEHYVHILFGYGLGYIANFLKNKINDPNELVIIDPIKKELNIEYEDIFSMDNFENLQRKLKNVLDNNRRDVKVICSPNYDKLLSKDYKKVLQLVKDIQRENQIEENTIRRFSDNWQENYTKNLFMAISDPSLKKLEKKYDCPVIIASGGPSLTKQIEQLKLIRKHIILIASGSTINTLLSLDIEPDYVVSIDGDEENHHHFKDLSLKNVDLLYSMSSHYQIQKEYEGRRFPFLTFADKHTGVQIKDRFGIDLPYIPGGGSVATFAFSIAKYISIGPIALIGQDLAYTNNQTHAMNNKYYKEIDKGYLESINAFEIEGYFGGKVITDYSFLTMKNMFEQIHKLFPHSSQVFNCTEGGVKLMGFDQISFREFSDKYITGTIVNKIPCEIQTLHQEGLFLEQLQNEISVYEKLEKGFLDAISLVKTTVNKFNFSPSVLKKLDKLDTKAKLYFELVRMERIIEPLTMDILRNYKSKENETSKESFERVYNQNLELYSSLLNVTKRAKQYTIETIELAKSK